MTDHRSQQRELGLPQADAARGMPDAEKERYRQRLAEYLKDPAFRAIEGFPLGTDEAILALSDPPYYTACPNPFLPEILEAWQSERAALREELGLPADDAETGNGYAREPYAADVSEGKNHPIYNAHSYHTKVPHKAIMRYILHYTDPGDIVYDGFCGTGMTGVAAQLCGDAEAVRELGYTVRDNVIYDGKDQVGLLGARKAVLNDLSPAATYIAYNYNTPVDAAAFKREAERILREVEAECGWMYETWHPNSNDPRRVRARINYTVWSDIFTCPNCSREIVFWEHAIDHESGSVQDVFSCPGCGATLAKSSSRAAAAAPLERAWETVQDRALGCTVRRARQIPVLINYSVGKHRFDKAPDEGDMALISRIMDNDIPYPFPTDRMPEGDESRRNDDLGVTHVHHFYTWRNLWALAALQAACEASSIPQCTFLLSSLNVHVNRMRRYQPVKPGGTPGLPGTLYISAISVELPPFDGYPRKLRDIVAAFGALASGRNALLTASASTRVDDGCADYIFTDPPFGGNLMYSELNFLWEAWLRVYTDNKPEAIQNRAQHKGLPEYQRLMEACFERFYAALKPGHWLTVEFHNSRNSVWNAIQIALQRAGFVVADVRTLDKQQGTFKQVGGTGAVKQDLIISAYRPRKGFDRHFEETSGTPESAWAFVRQHLAQVATGVQSSGTLEEVTERRDYLLYDRMVAYHLQRGATVPLSAASFYAGLKERFVARDGMYFLPEQVPAYDRARLAGARVEQMALFVSNEKSAVQWLRRQLDPDLGGAPQTYQEIQPLFLRELHQSRYEALPELLDILSRNFVEGSGGRWRLPDPKDAGDLEALRSRELLREFDAYAEGRGPLKTFRREAVLAGFRAHHAAHDYATVVTVAERLPRTALEDDADLMMYYDAATLVTGK
jgi:hypothetical protein